MKYEKLMGYGLLGVFGFMLLRNLTKIKEIVSPVNIDDKLRFLRLMKPIAENVYHDKGIKTVITMAQSALESNWATSRLAREANNLFGMTATQSWIDSGRQTTVAEKGRRFKVYNDWDESVQDWARLISTSTRYINLYKYGKTGDVSRYGQEVYNSGYAEDSNYKNALLARASEVNKYV